MKNFNSKFKIVLFSFILLHFAFCLLPLNKVYAGDFALGVYPPIIQIQANAPSVITKEVTIVNASTNPQDITIQLRLFTQSQNDNGQVSYTPSANLPYPDSSLFQKVQLLDGSAPVGGITLAPRQKKTLTLRIALPAGEQPADYYFSVVFLTNNLLSEKTSGSQIHAGIAVNVLLSVGPKTPTTGYLNEFSVPWFVQTGPVPFTISINNTSDHFIAPTGQILIHNMFGQLIGKVDLLPVNILQHSSRYIPTKGQENTNHPIALWNEKVLFGLYKAQLNVSLSRQGPLFTRTVYFFAMPIAYLIGFFLAIALLVLIIARIRMRTRENA